MTTTPPKKPPFRKGEWVRVQYHGAYRVVRCYEKQEPVMPEFARPLQFAFSPPISRTVSYAHLSGFGQVSVHDCCRASARELRAESARLQKRADELNAAADAVEKAKGKR